MCVCEGESVGELSCCPAHLSLQCELGSEVPSICNWSLEQIFL